MDHDLGSALVGAKVDPFAATYQCQAIQGPGAAAKEFVKSLQGHGQQDGRWVDEDSATEHPTVGEAVACVLTDGRTPPFAPGSFDLVLVDAPCSGTGTLRRHPEIKWRLEPRRIDELAALQRRLLAAAAELVAPTGLLIYATCSVEAEENEQVVEALEACFASADLTPRLPEGLPWLATPTGGVRILPHEHGDGFTVHAFRRQGVA